MSNIDIIFEAGQRGALSLTLTINGVPSKG